MVIRLSPGELRSLVSFVAFAGLVGLAPLGAQAAAVERIEAMRARGELAGAWAEVEAALQVAPASLDLRALAVRIAMESGKDAAMQAHRQLFEDQIVRLRQGWEGRTEVGGSDEGDAAGNRPRLESTGGGGDRSPPPRRRPPGGDGGAPVGGEGAAPPGEDGRAPVGAPGAGPAGTQPSGAPAPGSGLAPAPSVGDLPAEPVPREPERRADFFAKKAASSDPDQRQAGVRGLQDDFRQWVVGWTHEPAGGSQKDGPGGRKRLDSTAPAYAQLDRLRRRREIIEVLRLQTGSDSWRFASKSLRLIAQQLERWADEIDGMAPGAERDAAQRELSDQVESLHDDERTRGMVQNVLRRLADHDLRDATSFARTLLVWATRHREQAAARRAAGDDEGARRALAAAAALDPGDAESTRAAAELEAETPGAVYARWQRYVASGAGGSEAIERMAEVRDRLLAEIAELRALLDAARNDSDRWVPLLARVAVQLPMIDPHRLDDIDAQWAVKPEEGRAMLGVALAEVERTVLDGPQPAVDRAWRGPEPRRDFAMPVASGALPFRWVGEAGAATDHWISTMPLAKDADWLAVTQIPKMPKPEQKQEGFVELAWCSAVGFCRALTASEREAGRLPLDVEYRLPSAVELEELCRDEAFRARYARLRIWTSDRLWNLYRVADGGHEYGDTAYNGNDIATVIVLGRPR